MRHNIPHHTYTQHHNTYTTQPHTAYQQLGFQQVTKITQFNVPPSLDFDKTQKWFKITLSAMVVTSSVPGSVWYQIPSQVVALLSSLPLCPLFPVSQTLVTSLPVDSMWFLTNLNFPFSLCLSLHSSGVSKKQCGKCCS